MYEQTYLQQKGIPFFSIYCLFSAIYVGWFLTMSIIILHGLKSAHLLIFKQINNKNHNDYEIDS